MCNSWTTPNLYSRAYLIPSSWTSTIPIFHERVITISKKKSKGNRPAAPNPREDIHGNLFDYEEFMNSLWTAYEQFMNNNSFCNMFAGGGVTGAASLPSADGVALANTYLSRILRKVVLNSLCQNLSPSLKKTQPTFAEKDSWTSGTS